jgi:hypothetical protein
MSYLDQPRINFTGRFYTNVSTINNDLANYDPNAPVSDPGWNPNGIAFFKFDSCIVTGVQAPGDNSGLMGASLISQTKPAPGKLVDLDPDQQSLSQVIGVALNLKTASGAGFQGVLEPCNLQDMWPSAPNPEGDAGGSNASSTFVSILSSVQWTNSDKIAALKLLRGVTQNSQLAIRFVVGSFFFTDPSDPASGYGTLTGSIGPHLDGDPIQFARRRLMPPTTKTKKTKSDSASVTSGPPIHADFEIKKQAVVADAKARPPKFQACNFQLDAKNRRLSIDLANAIPLATFAGPPLQVGQLRAVIVAPDSSTKEVLQQPFAFTDQINKTQGGIVDVPLTAEQSKQLEGMRAGVELQAQSGGTWTSILAEHQSGKFVNISPFTARAVGGDSVTFELRAFQWGRALANEKLSLSAQPTQGTPPSLVIDGGSGSAMTDKNGRAVFTVKTPASLNIPADRQQLDSLCYLFNGPWTSLNGGLFSTTFNPPDRAILPAALVVWSPYPDAGMPNPTWKDQVQPIFDEYMRMYPGMKQIMDLTDLSVVQANLAPLLAVLSLPFDAPHRMPVTRDLSPQKIEVIKTWLKKQIGNKKKGAFAGKTHPPK